MKKAHLVILAIFFSFGIFLVSTSCNKKEYKDPNKALSYIWHNTQDGGKIPYGQTKVCVGNDTVFYFSASMNYNTTWNRKMLFVSFSVKNTTISQFWAEQSNLYWYIEEDDKRSDDHGYNLRGLKPKEIEIIKRAYLAYVNN